MPRRLLIFAYKDVSKILKYNYHKLKRTIPLVNFITICFIIQVSSSEADIFYRQNNKYVCDIKQTCRHQM